MLGNNSGDPLPSAEQRSTTTIMDLNMDSLVHCTSHLNLRDISNMAMSCIYLKKVAYSDSVWQSLSRARWPSRIPYYNSQKSSVRDAYLARHTALQQLKFEDPAIVNLLFNLKSHDHLLFLDNRIILSEGPVIRMLEIGINSGGYDSVSTLNDHRAKITYCFRSVTQLSAEVGSLETAMSWSPQAVIIQFVCGQRTLATDAIGAIAVK